MVTACLPYILDIIGTNTFLRVRQAWILRNLPAIEVSFQRRHTCVDPQQRRIVMRYEGRTRFNLVTFTFKKLKPFGTNFTCFHCLQLLSHLFNSAYPPECLKNKNKKTPLNNSGTINIAVPPWLSP
ncbi:hypothetical protein D3C76_750090 [compost metagenome]